MSRSTLPLLRTGCILLALGFVFGTLLSLDELRAAIDRISAHRYLHFGMYRLALDSFEPFLERCLTLSVSAAALLVPVTLFLRRSLAQRAVPRAVSYPGVVLAVPLTATLLLLSALLAWSRIEGERSAGNVPNIIFIGVDTLRADHMGVYGYERKTSARIDAWARDATVFRKCIASIPRTTQSLASILTAKYPSSIDVRNLKDQLPRGELSVAEVLRNARYRTLAVIATGVPHGKIGQGFDTVVEADPKEEYTADRTTDLALELLDKTAGPYFLFAFYRDPHMKYAPPKVVFDRNYRGKFRRKFRHDPDKARSVFKNTMDDRLRRHGVALYDSEIHFMDQEIGRLIKAVKERSDDTIIVFFADHGESLGEHDFFYDHGDLLYQPGLHIPLIIEGVSVDAARAQRVSRSIDIVPTVLEAAGIRVPKAEFEGVDLASSTAPLEAYSETGQVLIETAYETGRRHLPGLKGRLRSLVLEDRKLIMIPGKDGVTFEYYDLRSDPEELHDLSGEANFSEMRERLMRWVAKDEENWDRPERTYSEEDLKSLRSLGYL